MAPLRSEIMENKYYLYSDVYRTSARSRRSLASMISPWKCFRKFFVYYRGPVGRHFTTISSRAVVIRPALVGDVSFWGPTSRCGYRVGPQTLLEIYRSTCSKPWNGWIYNRGVQLDMSSWHQIASRNRTEAPERTLQQFTYFTHFCYESNWRPIW